VLYLRPAAWHWCMLCFPLRCQRHVLLSPNHCLRCDELELCPADCPCRRDSIDHASKYGVSYIAQPGGSIADDEVGV
jgi:hypothetical protein